MPETLEELLPDSVPSTWSGSPREEEKRAWRAVKTLRLVPGQISFKIFEGGKRKTYYGLRTGTDEDAQSDASGKIQSMLVNTESFDAAITDWFARAWLIAEDYLGTEPSLDAEPQTGKAECGDQPSIIGEIAEDWTSDRVADELLELDAENDWARLREVILTAEDFGFTAEQSAQLAPRLLELAIQYRASSDPQDAPAVFSAIRTGASMLRPNQAERLLALLEPGHPIETSLVALKMLGRIFEAQPPMRPDQHKDLVGEVRGIAEALLNRYAIASSQSAAMAQLAVYALAAMASGETLDIARLVRRIGVSWFKSQAVRELRELRSSWDARSVPVAPAVLKLLDRATRELETT